MSLQALSAPLALVVQPRARRPLAGLLKLRPPSVTVAVTLVVIMLVTVSLGRCSPAARKPSIIFCGPQQ